MTSHSDRSLTKHQQTSTHGPGFQSEFDRQEAEWAARYYVVREGWMWHVKCGSGTRSLMRCLRKRSADRAAAELLTAFRDGMFVITSKLRGGSRYA